jgi:hypothetical protein
MPPTWVDWLEARLPGGIPGVNHCGKASYEEVSRAQDLWELRVAEQEKKKRSQPSPLPETTGASR